MNKQDKIGFIGLGTMGLPMAKNLIKAGYSLIAFDIKEDRINLLKEVGEVQVAESPAEIAQQSKTIITMLPNSPHVESVILDENGLLQNLSKGSIVIDMSSIEPNVSIKLAKKVEATGSNMLDAPVSGGENGAIAGTLTIMVGGKESILNSVKPLLKVMGEKIIYCGDHGAGQTVKMVNQLMSAVNLIGMSEGFVLGAKAGVDPEVMMNVISNGSGSCWAVKDRMPVILEGNFKPGFTIDLHTKDINIAVKTAKELNVPIFIVALVNEIFKTAQAKGKGKLDNSAIITVYEELTGLEVRIKNK